MDVHMPSTIAKYILNSLAGDANNLKLQKLVYYSQAWHLAIHGTPLFEESVEAWIHGPVVPSIFQEYKSFGWSPILTDGHKPDLHPKTAEHIRMVLNAYGHLTGRDLENLTHSESPWREARKNLPADAPSRNVISHAAMKNFYRQRLNG